MNLTVIKHDNEYVESTSPSKCCNFVADDKVYYNEIYTISRTPKCTEQSLGLLFTMLYSFHSFGHSFTYKYLLSEKCHDLSNSLVIFILKYWNFFKWLCSHKTWLLHLLTGSSCASHCTIIIITSILEMSRLWSLLKLREMLCKLMFSIWISIITPSRMLRTIFISSV